MLYPVPDNDTVLDRIEVKNIIWDANKIAAVMMIGSTPRLGCKIVETEVVGHGAKQHTNCNKLWRNRKTGARMSCKEA